MTTLKKEGLSEKLFYPGAWCSRFKNGPKMAKVVKMKNDMFKNDQKETRHIQPTNCVNFFCFFFYIYYLASYLYSFYLWNHVGLLPCYCYYCTVSIIIQKILHVAWSQTHNVIFFQNPKFLRLSYKRFKFSTLLHLVHWSFCQTAHKLKKIAGIWSIGRSG